MKNPVKFGKYYLLERVNVGGMAEVFKAKAFGEAGFERLVAVKRVLPSIAEDHEFISMFIDEAKLAVQLTHPNIAQIFELGKVGDSYFIALEYVAGKDLRAIFDRARKRGERLPVPLACYVVMKICEGLDYAHNKKDAAGRSLELVHRDVSPQNMLISYDGDVKLIDFGIAKAASKSSKTQAGILKGKFGYMSPEQVRGLQIDRRSDIFAVGIVLYELLTMERLFVGESDFSTLEKVRNVEIMPPSTYNRTVPEELEQIVLKALAKHPEDRYRTAMDLHDDLQSFMYTSGNFFARKDLSAYMHRIFQDEIAKEAAKDEEYRRFDARKASDLDMLETAIQQPMVATGARNAPPLPPQARASVPPPPPPPAQRSQKSTMLGGFSPAPAPAPGPQRAAQPLSAASTPAAAASPTAARVASSPTQPGSAPAMDMDWDDEELATQVYDRPDGPPAGVSTVSNRPAATNAAPSSTSGSLPKQPTAPAVAPGAQFAGPRAPTLPLPSAAPNGASNLPQIPPTMAQATVRASLPATMAMPQPAFGQSFPGAPPAPFPPPPQAGPAVPAPMPNGPAVGPPMPMSMGVAVPAPSSPRSEVNQSAAATPAPPESKRKLLIYGGIGLVAIAAAVGIGFKLKANGDEPTARSAPQQPAVPPAPAMQAAVVPSAPTSPMPVMPGAAVAPLPVQAQPTGMPATPQAVATAPTPPVPNAPAMQPAPQIALPAAPAQPAPAQPAPAQPAPAQPAPAQPEHHASSARHRARTVSAPRPAPAPAPSGGVGYLSISTRPASRCTVAGQTFSTPRIRLELPAGSYRVTCTNTEFNVSGNFTVTIRAGQVTALPNQPLN